MLAAFASLYGVWLFAGPELVRNEGIYAAAAAEFESHSPAVATIHQWATPECFPLFPAVVDFLHRHAGVPMVTALRGLSIVMLFAGAVLVYLAASARRSCTAGWVAAAMYFSSILALDKSVVGAPATGNAFFLLAAQLLFFEFGFRRSDWTRAWMFASLLVTAGFFNGGFEVPVFFIFPMFFLRRPLSVSSKYRRAGFAFAVVIIVLAVLWWAKEYNAFPRRQPILDVWRENAAETANLSGLLTFPFAFVFMLLPWSVIAWMPFCVALQSLDTTPIFSRYLRTLVFPNLALLWLAPWLGRGAYFYVFAPLAILTGEFYEIGVRRYGERLRRFFITTEIFLAAVPAVIAIGCCVSEELLDRFVPWLSIDQSLDFRSGSGFWILTAVMFVSSLLLLGYVHFRRRSDPVWMILLSVTLALALVFNGLMMPYRSQDHSKRKFGSDLKRVLPPAALAGTIYTLGTAHLNGGLFYAGYPVCRLDSLDELSRKDAPKDAPERPVYLLCPEFPQSAEFSWENLLDPDYKYNGHSLALWKGTPRRPSRNDAAVDAGGKEKQMESVKL